VSHRILTERIPGPRYWNPSSVQKVDTILTRSSYLLHCFQRFWGVEGK
jgi:hypothetical protein